MATKKKISKKSRNARPKNKMKHVAKSKKKLAGKKRTSARVKTAKRKGAKKPQRRTRGRASTAELVTFNQPGLGARTGGQSGDTQGLSGLAETDSESVTELLEEGQSFEAEVVQGVENVPDADVSEVRTREVPEDDVPEEYLEDGDDGPERNSRGR
ncbi:MAG TPA: hypothetical protein VGF19_08340 [Candidatus Acidoferrum sp.]|jgi:hypothetical protein